MSNVASADIYRLADAMRQSAGNAEVTTQNVLIQSATYIKQDMEMRAPVRTGKLKQSIAIKVDAHKVTIGPNTDYAAYVEFGTKPHEIRPKNKKALSWIGPNGRRYAKVVHHPGTRPNPFVRNAFNDWADTLGAMAAQANIKRLEDGYDQ